MTKIKSDFASVARVPLPPLREAAPQTAIVLAAAKAEFKPRTERKAERHFADAGDEASVLRGREAWLRSLDRKYGITR